MSNKKIRVLNVSFVPLSVNGGIEMMIMNFLRKFDHEIISVDIVSCTPGIGDFDDEIKSFGGKVFSLPSIKKKPFHHLFQMYRIIKSGNYNVVHAHISTRSVIPLFMAKRCKIAVRIMHSHNAGVKSYRWGIIDKFLELFINRYSTCRLACSTEAGIELFKDTKFFVLNHSINAIDYSYSPSIRKKYREKYGIEGKFVIGTVGRLCYQKNHDFLLDVFQEIHRRCKNSILLLIGEGELRNELERKVKKLGITAAVRFIGKRSDVPSWLQSMDVFVFPSHYEGFGLAALESQAAGLQTITSDTIPRAVNVTGYYNCLSLTQPPSVWAEYILKYQNGYERRNTYTDIVNAQFDIHNTAQNLLKYYGIESTSDGTKT